MDTVEARQELQWLERLKVEQEARLAALDADLKRLERSRGERALEAIESGGDTAPLVDIVGQVNACETERATVKAMLDALDVRLAQTKAAQREAVCSELLRRADALDAEVAERETRLSELCKLIRDFEESGVAVALHPAQRKTVVLERRAQGTRNAILFVARGLPCPRDDTTGLPFDDDLW